MSTRDFTFRWMYSAEFVRAMMTDEMKERAGEFVIAEADIEAIQKIVLLELRAHIRNALHGYLIRMTKRPAVESTAVVA